MSSRQILGETALVVGAGVGGLFAAGALRHYFRQVVLLERDKLPQTVAFRKGVPQGPHGHAVLKRGENIAEDFFPGFREALRRAGGVELNIDHDAGRFEAGSWSQSADSGITISSQSRALLEHVLRQRALACENIVIRDGVRVSDLLLSEGQVSGVRIELGQGKSETLSGDLVVEATGRSGELPTWLANNGFSDMPTESLGINLVYVTGIFRAESFADGKPMVSMLRESPPGKRGGAVMPIEDTRWMVTLNGRQGDVPPIDMDGFLAYAKSLPDPVIYDRIRNSKLEGRLQRFIIAQSYWRHYEQMAQFPERLIPLGDAVAGFNPVFGQGMSAAAVDAEQLKHVLDARASAGGDLTALHQDYFPRVAEVVGAAWNGTATYDLMYDTTVGERPDDYPMRRAAFLAMQELGAEDKQLRRQQIRVGNMLDAPATLFTEEVLNRLQDKIAAQLADQE